MSIQLEVVKFRDLVEVTGIPRFVPNLSAPTLEVTGTDFTSVESVKINEVKATEFIVLNENKMWVQLPDAAQDRISNIEVVSSRFTRTNNASKLSFLIGEKTKTVSGILKLIQLFTKWLLQSPGSDVFNPERGGGLQEFIGQVTSSRGMEPIMASIARSVQTTASQIRATQTGQSGLPTDERLLSAEATGLSVDQQLMGARVNINIRSLAGDQAVAALDL